MSLFRATKPLKIRQAERAHTARAAIPPKSGAATAVVKRHFTNASRRRARSKKKRDKDMGPIWI